MKLKLISMALIPLSMGLYSAESLAMTASGSSSSSTSAGTATSIPTRGDVCELDSKTKIESHLKSQEDACKTNYGINEKNNYEKSKFFSKNEDANCNLGFKFPDLPGLNFDFSLDACKVLQAVTEDVVNEVNNTMQDAVDSATESITGDKDGLNLDVDGTAVVKDTLDGKSASESAQNQLN